MGTIFIYGLYDSGFPDTIRYVGKTRCVETRLRQHLKKSEQNRTHRSLWIQSVMRAGRSVCSVVFDAATDVTEANDLERRYIAAFRSAGARLTNATEGGDGQSPGFKWTAEATAKRIAAQTGKKRDRASVEKTAAAHRGMKRSLETCARISAAKLGRPVGPFSDAHIANIRAAKRAHPVTDAHKAVIAASNRGRVWTEEIRRNASEGQLRRRAAERASDGEARP